MVIRKNHNEEHNGNLETVATLDEAGQAIEAAGLGRYTHNKQGPCEWWTFWLGGGKRLNVTYAYTPVATSWGHIYQREQGTFRCELSWTESYGFYPSLEQAATVERGEALTLEQALSVLEQSLADELGVAA